MDWTPELTLELIDLYKAKDCLWNPKCSHYKFIDMKNYAWLEIADEINAKPSEVKRKMNSILASFRRERQKENDNKKSTWFAFQSLDFLRDKFAKKRMLKTEQSEAVNVVDIATEEIPVQDAPTIKLPKTAKKKKIADQIEALLGSKVTKKSNNSIYGEYVASKLDSYSLQCQNTVQHLINNILYEADMGKYGAGCRRSPTSSSSTNSGKIPDLCSVIAPENIKCKILNRRNIEDDITTFFIS